MYAFDYHRCTSVAEALQAHRALDDARYIAGGQSLLPMMKLRFAKTDNIIDLRDCAELRSLSRDEDTLTIGAMTRHADVATASVVREAIPALARLAGGIGDPAVRAQGTLGGSIANNDPSACYPSACLALGATILTTAGEIEADDFFLGVFETALGEGELVTGAQFPIPDAAAYVKFRHPASRFALVGVFVARFGGLARVAVTGAGRSGAYRWLEAEDALSNRFESNALAGLWANIDGMNSDIHGDAEYRAHLVDIIARRAVEEAIQKTNDQMSSTGGPNI
jgi:carbon-monoxide dehydrogenase medium subunit